MIGDNGGGIAILMDNKEQNIFAVGMGVMNEDSLEKNIIFLRRISIGKERNV